ncbi:MAG: TonB-dependent receptor [Gammaproteobacteria bacterium]|nr:TonB-dependent receptor [Gammaproteobacteria bacterium]
MKYVKAGLAGLIAFALPQAAFGEDAGEAGADIIEEVIVTATKREESVQDVPIAVSAFAGEDLVARGVEDLYGLAEVAPSIAVYGSNSTSNGGTLRIRGVGTTGNNPGLEAAVGTFIDGIYRSRAGLAFNDLIDIDRVEILRGPQGTLFGKNTVAGAVNIITRKPEFENTLDLTLGAGDFNSGEMAVVGNGILSEDVLAARVTYAYRQRDGFYENIDTGDAYDDRDRHNVRLQLLWTPSDDVEVRIIGDRTERDETCCPAAFWIPGPTSPVVAALGGDITPFEVDSSVRVGVNYEPYEIVRDQGLSVDVLWEADNGVSFRSVTARRDYEVARGQDIDFTSADILHPQDTDESFENISQEVQLYGETDNVSWLVGAYMYTEELESDEYIVFSNDGGTYLATLFGAPPLAAVVMGDPAGRGVPGQGYDALFFSDTEGWSAFTHNVWHATERFDVTLGLRYSTEEKDAGAIINGAPFGESVSDPFCGIVPIASLCDNLSYNNKEDESEVTGTLKGALAITEEVNLYGSYSRGYKAGGFNLDQEAVGFRDENGNPVDQSRFDPETSDSFELGVKARGLDGRLTVNTALFHTKFDQFQLNTFTGLGFTVGNVKEVVSQGVEMESMLALGGGVFLTAGFTYADARYDDNLVAANAHLEGKRVTQSPLWQSSMSVFVERDIPNTDWRFLLNANWSHIGEANTGSDLDPEKVRAAMNLLNAQFGVRSSDGRYEAVIWGRNLTDKTTNFLVFDSVFQGGSWHTFVNPPRTAGVTIRVSLL